MSATHPYISGPGNIAQIVNHLRKNFPSTVTSDTVKRLSIAPNNESYVINALQFIGVLDEEGNKTEEAAKVFSIHKDEEFYSEFSKLVKSSYEADQTSATIGARQAGTYLVFKALSGHGELPSLRKAGTKKAVLPSKGQGKTASIKTKQRVTKVKVPSAAASEAKSKGEVAITVRVEINLPGDGTKETYDNIFKSIRENLMDE